jgi:hypothetical protein
VYVYGLTQLEVVFIMMCLLHSKQHVSALFMGRQQAFISGDVIIYICNIVTYEILYFRL